MMFSTEPPSVSKFIASRKRGNRQSSFRHDGLFEFVFSQLLRSLGYQCARRSSSIGRDTNSRSRSRAASSSETGRWPCCDSLPLLATKYEKTNRCPSSKVEKRL